MPRTRPTIRAAAALLAVLGMAPAASAQLASASAASLALGDNYTALARGYNAVNWNPAGLGMPDNPLFSFAFAGTGTGGTGPISLGDFKQYGGVTVPNAVLASWLARVQAQGGQSFDVDGAASMAMSIGNIGFQLSTDAYERGKLNPDAVQVLLYGNAGLTGSAQDMNFQGSRTEAAVATTAALSFGRGVDFGVGPMTQHFSLGATVKYIVGNALLFGEDAGSVLQASPLAVDVRFPMVQSDTSFNRVPQHGHGVGVDVGAAWQSGPLSAGVTIQNFVNTFHWDVSQMYFRPGGAVFGSSATRSTSFDAVSMSALPDSLKAQAAALSADIQAMHFTPSMNVGVAMKVLPFLTATGDLRQQLGDGMHLGDRTHLGAGAELRIIPFLPVRAGVAGISGGYIISAGAGLELFFFHLNAGVAERKTQYGSYPGGAVTISLGQ